MGSFRKYTFLYHWQHFIIPRNRANAAWMDLGGRGEERFLIENSEILKAIQEVTACTLVLIHD